MRGILIGLHPRNKIFPKQEQEGATMLVKRPQSKESKDPTQAALLEDRRHFTRHSGTVTIAAALEFQ